MTDNQLANEFALHATLNLETHRTHDEVLAAATRHAADKGFTDMTVLGAKIDGDEIVLRLDTTITDKPRLLIELMTLLEGVEHVQPTNSGDE